MTENNKLKEYEEFYREFLYGRRRSTSKMRKIEDCLTSAEAEEIRFKVIKKYREEIVTPLKDELLSLLQFEGLVKGSQFKKRAEELKAKFKKNDKDYWIREQALEEFFKTKRGSKYSESDRLTIALKLGALDTRNL